MLYEGIRFLLQHYLLILASLTVARIVYLKYISEYSDIPGPFLASISPLWKVYGAWNGTLHKDILKGHQKYGRLLRIAPDEISISDPEAIKIIYGIGSGFTKVFLQKLKGTDNRQISIVLSPIISRQGYLHRRMRRNILLNDD
jgi:hypothetical protein